MLKIIVSLGDILLVGMLVLLLIIYCLMILVSIIKAQIKNMIDKIKKVRTKGENSKN